MKITQVEMSRSNVTRKLYNPRRNVLDSINDVSKNKSSEVRLFWKTGLFRLQIIFKNL